MLRIRKNQNNLVNNLSLIAYSLYLVIFIFDQSQYANTHGFIVLKRIICVIIIILLLLSFYIKKIFPLKLLISITAISIIGVISGITSDRLNNLIFIIIFIVAGTYIDPNRIFETYVKVSSLVVLLVIALSLTKTPDLVKTIGGIRKSRYYLGFSWTTYAPNYFFHITISYFSISHKKVSISNTIFFFIINIIFFILTDTKAVYYELLFYLLILWSINLTNKTIIKNIFEFITPISFPLFMFLSIILSYFYDSRNNFLYSINSLLTHRLALGQRGFTEFGITLFGTPIVWGNSDSLFNIDSSYLNILFNYGVIVLLLVVFSFTLLSTNAYKSRKYYLCASLLILSIHSFSDPQLFSLRYNPFILPIGTLLVKNNNSVQLE